LSKAEGFRAFGKLLRDVAKKLGVVVKHEPVQEDRLREVVFYDTAGYALYEASFMLRKRTRHRDGWPTADPELTLKFRHPDLDTAAAVDVRPLSDSYRMKFKEELLPLRDRAGGMRSLFSHTAVLTASEERSGYDVAHAARVFPALRTVLGGRGATPLAVVQEARLTEVLEPVGVLDFGHGVVGKADVAVWRTTALGPALIGEFSFQLRFERDAEMHRKARKHADELFTRLQTAARAWLALGITKTAVVYGLGKKAPRHAE
jgi:hypothetical protein